MSEDVSPADVVIVGGGIIGLSSALKARSMGLSVTLLERGLIGAGATHVAAGMLAPIAEAEFGEAGRLSLGLGVRSAQMWPRFAGELEEDSGVGVGLRQTGTLMVARDEDEARELERQISFRDSLGLHTVRLLPSEARELEPALAPTLRLALRAPEDHSVDPRLVLAALSCACAGGGVSIREHSPVAALAVDRVRGHVVGVELDDGRLVPAGTVVVACGAWSALLGGLEPGELVPVRPVKGQILRLHDPDGPGLLTGVLRYEGGYLVPRADGHYVLGASMEERGFESEPSAGAVYELLRAAQELIPGVAELRLDEIGVGFRPGSPDNVPLIGRGTLDGLIWATGHHRNGILLAPLTAELVTGAITGVLPDALSELSGVCDPHRSVLGRSVGGVVEALL
jgi:glycine oxidase